MEPTQVQINKNEPLLGKSAYDIAKKLGLPYDFVSEIILDNPDFRTMGELVVYMTKECRRELIKIKNTG